MVRGQWREFGQDTGVTPLLFTRSAMGFLMTTESQDLGLTSHPKDGPDCYGFKFVTAVIDFKMYYNIIIKMYPFFTTPNQKKLGQYGKRK